MKCPCKHAHEFRAWSKARESWNFLYRWKTPARRYVPMFNSWSTPKSCFLAGCISISVVVLPRAWPTFERVRFVNRRRKSGETGIDLESQDNVLTYNLDTIVVFDQRSFERFFHVVHPSSSNCRLTREMVKKCYDFLFFYIHSFLFLSFVLCLFIYSIYIIFLVILLSFLLFHTVFSSIILHRVTKSFDFHNVIKKF